MSQRQNVWKERLKEREDTFVTTHPSLSIVNTLEELEQNKKGKLFEQISFDFPILVQNGLVDLKIPRKDWNIQTLCKIVGPEEPLTVIDVKTQQNEGSKWTMQRWTDYFSVPYAQRKRLLNVISLEFSNTPLRQHVSAPEIVQKHDWIEHVWPKDTKSTEHLDTNVAGRAFSPTQGLARYPKVQYYLLMGSEGSYTDFHIDFGGSSVWYHVLVGEKQFFMLPPTPLNLSLYEKWVSSPDQDQVFLSDLASHESTIKVVVKAGNTLLIPSGWIHSVYTPVDTLVVGGNFLHKDAIEMQLTVFDIEERTKVPYNCRFPFFVFMQWYFAKHFIEQYGSHPSPPEITLSQREGILSQIDFLTRWEPLFPSDIGVPGYYIRALSAILKGKPIPKPTDVPLFCVCQQPDNGETRSWIACDFCSEWLHLDCVGLSENKNKKRNECYFCPNCVKNIPEKQRNYFKQKRMERNQAVKQADKTNPDRSKLKRSSRSSSHSEIKPTPSSDSELTGSSSPAIKFKWKGQEISGIQTTTANASTSPRSTPETDQPKRRKYHEDQSPHQTSPSALFKEEHRSPPSNYERTSSSSPYGTPSRPQLSSQLSTPPSFPFLSPNVSPTTTHPFPTSMGQSHIPSNSFSPTSTTVRPSYSPQQQQGQSISFRMNGTSS